MAQNFREPNARVELTALRTGDGLRARGTAALFTDPTDAHALLVQAALRGPLAPATNGTIEPARPAIDARELNCLSQAVYYEARGESYQGQVAVAEVVVNRTRSSAYPKTICSVVYQGANRSTGCQFTFTCDGSAHRRPRGRAWERAQQVASQVMQGYARPVTQRATHYHTRAVDPVWSSMLVETTRIGTHIFYRFPNATERAALQERRRASRQADDTPAVPPGDEAAAAATDAAQTPAAATTPPAETSASIPPAEVGA